MQGAEQGVMQGAEQGVVQGGGDTESGTEPGAEPGAEELLSPRGQRQKRWEMKRNRRLEMKQNRIPRLIRYLEPFPQCAEDAESGTEPGAETCAEELGSPPGHTQNH